MASLKLFGKYNGKNVYLIKLTNGTIEAEFITFGATLRALRVADKNNNITDVCLGYDSVEEYATNDGYLGASIGRHANRIGGARFSIGDKEYILTANEGENQLHGGICGFSHRLWGFSCEENAVTFFINSPDGDEGYPGNLHAEVRYSIDGKTLRIDYKATSDADTIVNLTNHAYFNLGGHDGGKIDSHILKLNADTYTVCGAGNIPTGEIAAVDETILDMRRGVKLGDVVHSAVLAETCGLDHNFVLSGSPAAELYCPETGICMQLNTTLEGLQVYSAGFLTERNGKDDAVYREHNAVCLETQHFPDAINLPVFPSPILKAGEEYRQSTLYSFSVQ